MILSALAAGCGREETEMCMSVEPDAAECPAAEDVDPAELFHLSDCDLEARAVTSEGTLGPDPYGWDSGNSAQVCCYEVVAKDTTPRSDCIVGRPFLEAGAPTVAPDRADAAWSGAPEAEPRDGALAEAWLEMARMEHASIAAFSKLSLQLMAASAPPELLAAVHAAAGEEVAHAADCYAQAARFSGRAVSPGAFPFAGALGIDGDLTRLAVDAAREGCLGETLGAWMARRMAEAAQDPRSKAVLTRIAEDEARHAALSWRIVAWAIREGGAPVREAVAEAFTQPFPIGLPLQVEGAEAHGAGVIDEAMLEEAVSGLIRPAARALLAA
ncbi:MAG: ferritin-like domain-containing protein [Alphaproteobacteria bacterium]|nr:ferritin-like domain-containing protein [Alphaproteobacteria bacterium]